MAFGQLMAPAPGFEKVAPPDTPEQQQALESEWMDFFKSPSFAAMALQFGASMLAPGGGNFGVAAAEGAAAGGRTSQALHQMSLADAENARQNEELNIRGQGLDIAKDQNQIDRERLAADIAAQGDTRAYQQGQLDIGRITADAARLRAEKYQTGGGKGSGKPPTFSTSMPGMVLNTLLKAETERAAMEGEDPNMDAVLSRWSEFMAGATGDTAAPAGGGATDPAAAAAPEVSGPGTPAAASGDGVSSTSDTPKPAGTANAYVPRGIGTSTPQGTQVPVPQGEQLPQVTGPDDPKFKALEKGAQFLGPDGKKYRKTTEASK